MANELSTLVPAQRSKVKGVEKLLTQEDIAEVLAVNVRFVREQLIQTGLIPSFSLGPRSYRVRPRDLQVYIEKGCPGFKHRRK